MADQVTQVPPQGEQKIKKEKKYRAPSLQSNPAVKINDLQPRNNNSNFVGKIVEVQVLEKGNNKQGNPRKFLKGLIGDETGVVRFDLAVKNDVVFKEGDIINFDKAMNKVNKDGHHYVEIKRFGKYEVATGVSVASVKNENNLSTKIIPPLPEGEKKPKIVHNNKGNKQNNNIKQGGNNGRVNNQKNNNQQYQNKSRNNNNNQNRGDQNYKKKPQNKRVYQPQPTPIKSLAPGQNGQTVKGKVFNVESYKKTIKNREATFFKGRVADESANINFDFMMKQNRNISEGDMVIFTNIMNKVSETRHHYIVVGKYGNYSVLNQSQINIGEQENKSSIEYTVNPNTSANKQ